MDKLELDERVSRLEQKVSLLTALILAFLGLVGVGVAFLLVKARPEVMFDPPREMLAPTPVRTEVRSIPPVPPPATTAVTKIGRDSSEGSVEHLIERLRDLDDLQQRSVLSPLEFQTKKSQLLAKPVRSTNLKTELDAVAELQSKDVLNPLEFQTLKTKILESGK